MQLSPKQLDAIKEWIAKHFTLAQIQSEFKNAFDISLTYQELRMLFAENNLEIQPKASQEKSPQATGKDPLSEPTPPQSVSVTLDPIQRPGVLMGGSVTFSDGMTGTWQLDAMNRIGISPSQEHYKPSQKDLKDFQLEIQKLLQQGML